MDERRLPSGWWFMEWVVRGEEGRLSTREFAILCPDCLVTRAGAVLARIGKTCPGYAEVRVGQAQ